ncbi:MAG: GNAT family N-acetyltransferase, partial [Haloarculaceae archaeon]
GRSERAPFVATIDGGVIGLVQTVPDEDDEGLAHLFCTYVAPEPWGRGIGGSLLGHVETIPSDRGFAQLHLSVIAENDVGVNFYASSGFHRVGTNDNDHLDTQG